MRKVLLCASVIVGMTAYSFISLDTGPGADHASNHHASSRTTASPPASQEAVTDEQKQIIRQGDTASQEDDKHAESSISDAIMGLAMPKKIVSKLLADYRSKENPSTEERIEVLSALSFCANKRELATVIGEKRGDGVATQEEMQGLNSTYEGYIKYCADLADESYLTRRLILDALAKQGNAEARSMYFEVGPLGRWPQDNEYIPLSKEDINDWINTSISHLHSNVKEGDFRIYKTLAAIHGSSPDDAILGQASDKIKSYAYDYLWVTFLAANPSTPSEVKSKVADYLKHRGKELSAAQIDQARRSAMKIHLESKPEG